MVDGLHRCFSFLWGADPCLRPVLNLRRVDFQRGVFAFWGGWGERADNDGVAIGTA